MICTQALLTFSQMVTALHNVWRHSPFELAEFSCVMLVLILYVHIYMFQSSRDVFLSSLIEPALNIGLNILLKGNGFGESRSSNPSTLSLTPYQLSYCAPQQKSVKHCPVLWVYCRTLPRPVQYLTWADPECGQGVQIPSH